MLTNVVPLAAEPYTTWDEGILALCEAVSDHHRLPAVLRRLERTAEHLTLTAEDLCILALVSPLDVSAEDPEPVADPAEQPAQHQQSSEMYELYARLRNKIFEATETPIRRREKAALSAFGPDDPRRILSDTIWGIVAAGLAHVSDRLAERDPFMRLARRLGLWFAPASGARWMGVKLGDVSGVLALLERLVRGSKPASEDDALAHELLMMAVGKSRIPSGAEAGQLLCEILNARRSFLPTLFAAILMARLESLDWQDSDEVRDLDGLLADLLEHDPSWSDDSFDGSTGSIPVWLQRGRKPFLLPDVSHTLSALSAALSDWTKTGPRTLKALVRLIERAGPSSLPQGPFPLNFFGGWDKDQNLPADLAEPLPEAHDLMRLLSLRDGDWAEAGGEFSASFWGDPKSVSVDVVDLRQACCAALDRGDPALADMLIGAWLLFWLHETRRPLPYVADIAGVIRRIPSEDRVSINAVLGLAAADMAADATSLRHLDALRSYLPPVPAVSPSDPEAELRAHLGDEAWGWLSVESRRVLVENERLFRDWLRLGTAEADARGPAKLLPHWAAVFEPLLRRALRRCDRGLAIQVTDKTPLGELLHKVEAAWRLAEAWPEDDARRRYLIGGVWLEMLADLNRVNTQWGKHLVSTHIPSPGWHDVAALRSRIIFGGALRHCLEAAGQPAAP